MSSPSCLLPPPSCLSWLIKRVIKGDCDWVEAVKSEARVLMSLTGNGVFYLFIYFFKFHRKVLIRCRRTCARVHQRGGERKGGVVYKHELGSRGGRREKGKREGEDTSAAAWFTECTVTMETFVSPLSSIQSGSPTSGVWGWGGGGGGTWPGGGWDGIKKFKKGRQGVLTKKSHPLECLSYLLFGEGCIWCNCIGNVNKMLLPTGLLAASPPPARWRPQALGCLCLMHVPAWHFLWSSDTRGRCSYLAYMFLFQ